LNWALTGWVFIGLGIVLIIVLIWGIKVSPAFLRTLPFTKRLIESRAETVECGRYQQIFLGDNLLSQTYPGLGLSALGALPVFLDGETLVDGNSRVSSPSGEILVFAQQILQSRYQDGFSEPLAEDLVRIGPYGPTPISFIAGLLPALPRQPYGTLVLLGDYGPQASLAVKAVLDQGGRVFAAAGSITSQAALFLNVRDILLGEEVFRVSEVMLPDPQKTATILVEDILRVLLILLLVIGAGLTMVGVL